jgi:hypothetical protein
MLSKINKFQIMVHLIGFSIEICYDARTYERQIGLWFFLSSYEHCYDLITTFNSAANFIIVRLSISGHWRWIENRNSRI